MNIAYKYRLYPDKKQEELIVKTFGCCRKVYNLMLAEKIEAYNKTGKFCKVNPAKYKKDHPYLKEVDSRALANVWTNLEAAFHNCFSKNRKKKNGFPKFKSAKHSRRAYTTYNLSGTIRLTDRGIRLPKLCIVKAVIHRKPDAGWKLKSVTVSQNSDGKFYASVLFEYEAKPFARKLNPENSIAFDYASRCLYVDSAGNQGSEHKFYAEASAKLKKAQRRLSRKVGSKKGEEKSKNYLKQLRKVNRIHQHIRNQRHDLLHKKSTEIANRYDLVCVETLNMQAIANKKRHLGRSTYDNSNGKFLNLLEYKLKNRGKRLIRVGKFYPSSQICSHCGCIHKEMKDLSKRTLECECGAHIDRDFNAALNILKEGLRIYEDSQNKVGPERSEPNACGHDGSLGGVTVCSQAVVVNKQEEARLLVAE